MLIKNNLWSFGYLISIIIGLFCQESIISYMLILVLLIFRSDLLGTFQLTTAYFIVKVALIISGASSGFHNFSNLMEILILSFTIYRCDKNFRKREKMTLILKSSIQVRLIVLGLVTLSALPIVKSLKASLSTLFVGYDNVGHFAMWRIWSECQTFLFNCKSAEDSLPISYLEYPTQWHLLFSVRSDFDLKTNVLIYTAATIVTFIFSSLTLTNVAVEYHIKCSEKENVNDVGTYDVIYSKVVSVFLILISVFLWNSGYPNFLFSITLMVAGIFFSLEGNKSKMLIGLVLISFAGYFYTLFLIPTTFLVFCLSARGQFFRGQVKRLAKVFILNLVNILLSAQFLIGSLSNGQFDAVTETSKTSVIVVIWMVFFPILVSPRIRLIEINLAIVLVILYFVGYLLQIILFLQNISGGYFMFKYWIMLFVVTLVFVRPYFNFQKVQDSRLGLFISNELVSFFVILAITSQLSWVPSSNLLGVIKQRIAIVINDNDSSSSEIIALALIAQSNQNPSLVMSPSYFRDTQWVASIAGNWTTNLQTAIVEMAILQSETGSFPTKSDFIQKARKFKLNLVYSKNS